MLHSTPAHYYRLCLFFSLKSYRNTLKILKNSLKTGFHHHKILDRLHRVTDHAAFYFFIEQQQPAQSDQERERR